MLAPPPTPLLDKSTFSTTPNPNLGLPPEGGGVGVLTSSAALVDHGGGALVGLPLQHLVVPDVLHVALGDDAHIHVGTRPQIVVDPCTQQGDVRDGHVKGMPPPGGGRGGGEIRANVFEQHHVQEIFRVRWVTSGQKIQGAGDESA